MGRTTKQYKEIEKVKETIEVTPGRIHAEHGWWFPEQDGAEPNFYGTYDSNLNNMTEPFRQGIREGQPMPTFAAVRSP